MVCRHSFLGYAVDFYGILHALEITWELKELVNFENRGGGGVFSCGPMLCWHSTIFSVSSLYVCFLSGFLLILLRNVDKNLKFLIKMK